VGRACVVAAPIVGDAMDIGSCCSGTSRRDSGASIRGRRRPRFGGGNGCGVGQGDKEGAWDSVASMPPRRLFLHAMCCRHPQRPQESIMGLLLVIFKLLLKQKVLKRIGWLTSDSFMVSYKDVGIPLPLLM
jgi:hypothetical protein